MRACVVLHPSRMALLGWCYMDSLIHLMSLRVWFPHVNFEFLLCHYVLDFSSNYGYDYVVCNDSNMSPTPAMPAYPMLIQAHYAPEAHIIHQNTIAMHFHTLPLQLPIISTHRQPS